MCVFFCIFSYLENQTTACYWGGGGGGQLITWNNKDLTQVSRTNTLGMAPNWIYKIIALS